MIFYGILTSSLVAAFYAAVTFFAMLRLFTLFHSPLYSLSFAFLLLFIRLLTPFHSPFYSLSFAFLLLFIRLLTLFRLVLAAVSASSLLPLCCLSAA